MPHLPNCEALEVEALLEAQALCAGLRSPLYTLRFTLAHLRRRDRPKNVSSSCCAPSSFPLRRSGPYVGNTLGASNYRSFVIFMWFGFFGVGMTLVASFQYLLRSPSSALAWVLTIDFAVRLLCPSLHPSHSSLHAPRHALHPQPALAAWCNSWCR